MSRSGFRKRLSHFSLLPPPGKSRPIRLVLLGLLLVGVVWAFNKNFERRFEAIQGARDVQDPGQRLSPEERGTLNELVRRYKKDYGIQVVLRLADAIPAAQDMTAQTLLVLVGVEKRENVVRLPLLVRKALSEDMELLLSERLALCLEAMPPGVCLEQLLRRVLAELEH